jgi:hypothetical protein
MQPSETLVEAAGVVPKAKAAGHRSKPKRPATNTNDERSEELVEAAGVEL